MDEAIRQSYEKLASGSLTGLDIPHSKVFYARLAIYNRTGVWYDLEHIKISLWLEGDLHPNDLKTIPEWYRNKFMGGRQVNMNELRAKVRMKYNQKQKELQAEKVIDTPGKV